MTDSARPNEFVILADESAGWVIAGLRQLDRLLLAINESASTQHRPRVRIFWKPGVEAERGRISDARFIDIDPWDATEAIPGEMCLLSTHVCLFRNSVDDYCEMTGRLKTLPSSPSWLQLFETHLSRCRHSLTPESPWRLAETREAIDQAESALLESASKAQDGIISKWVNRPASRLVARQLLRFPIRPDQVTFAILVLPIMSAVFLARGNYASIVVGAAVFQLFSVLDGCDGEIARAKYLDSPRGARIDHVSDQVGNILFLIGLSIGLYRHHDDAFGQRYFLEGIICATLLTLYELVLWRWPARPSAARSHEPAAYQRHRGMLEHSGINLIGAKGVAWLIQLTKRDVSIVIFLGLAMAGLPQWIIHLWLVVTMGSILLTGIAMVRAAQLSA